MYPDPEGASPPEAASFEQAATAKAAARAAAEERFEHVVETGADDLVDTVDADECEVVLSFYLGDFPVLGDFLKRNDKLEAEGLTSFDAFAVHLKRGAGASDGYQTEAKKEDSFHGLKFTKISPIIM